MLKFSLEFLSQNIPNVGLVRIAVDHSMIQHPRLFVPAKCNPRYFNPERVNVHARAKHKPAARDDDVATIPIYRVRRAVVLAPIK